MVNLVALQMTSTPDVDENLDTVAQALAHADIANDSVVVLPECFACFGTKDGELLSVAEPKDSGKIQKRLSALAKQHQCYIVSGTFPMQTNDDSKFSAACLLFGPNGETLADYRKIHLFDVSVNDNTGSYKESRLKQPGAQVVVAAWAVELLLPVQCVRDELHDDVRNTVFYLEVVNPGDVGVV